MLETNELLKTKLSHSEYLITLSDEDVVRVQKELLKIFRDMIFVMEKYHIPYILGGGSVLGAIRHQGFIPWDDDIDINVERRYLTALKEAMEKEFGEKYYVQCPLLCKEHYSTFWDVQKTGTVFMESLAQDPQKCGLKVDIFPIENTYSNKFLRMMHGLLCDGSSFVLSCIRFHDRKQEYEKLCGDDENAKKVIRIKSIIGGVFAISKNFWLKFANGVFSMCKNDNSKYVVVPSGRKHFFGELYEREKFVKSVEASFEGEKVFVPADTKGYLVRLFGEDYMKIPEVAKREHHMVYKMEL